MGGQMVSKCGYGVGFGESGSVLATGLATVSATGSGSESEVGSNAVRAMVLATVSDSGSIAESGSGSTTVTAMVLASGVGLELEPGPGTE